MLGSIDKKLLLRLAGFGRSGGGRGGGGECNGKPPLSLTKVIFWQSLSSNTVQARILKRLLILPKTKNFT